MSNEPRMTGMDKKIFNATRTLTSLLNDACNHWNYLCPYLEKLAGVADDALRGYQKDYPEQVAELIDYQRKRDSQSNAAATREALMLYRKLFEDGVICTSYANSAAEMDELEELYHKTSAALSAPPRVCDVNTLESLSDFVEKIILTSDLLKDTPEIVKRIVMASVRTALTVAYEPAKRK